MQNPPNSSGGPAGNGSAPHSVENDDNSGRPRRSTVPPNAVPSNGSNSTGPALGEEARTNPLSAPHGANNNNNNNYNGSGAHVPPPPPPHEAGDQFSHRDSNVPFGGPDSYLFRFPSAVPTGNSSGYPTEENQPTPVAIVQSKEPFPSPSSDVYGGGMSRDVSQSSPLMSARRQAAAAAQNHNAADSSQEMYPVFNPVKKKSLMQRKAHYKSVMDPVMVNSFAAISNASLSKETSVVINSSGDLPTVKKGGKFTKIVDGLHNETHGDTSAPVHILDNGESMNMYSFFIGESRPPTSAASFGTPVSGRSRRHTTVSASGSSYSSSSSSSTSSSRSNSPDKKVSPSTREKNSQAALSAQMSEVMKSGSVDQFNVRRQTTKTSAEFQGSVGDISTDMGKKGKVTFEVATSSDDDEDFSGGPAQTYMCETNEDLEDDTVSLWTYWESLNSPALFRAVFFAFRTMLLAVMPTFVLTTHPNTAPWFKGGILMPVLAGLMCREIIGMQLMIFLINLQAAIVFMVWGVLMNAIGAKDNTAGWWCAVIFGSFSFGLLGQLPSKRFMMMFVVIIMQTEHMPGGTELTFPCYFARDIILASFFCIFACCVPFPARATVKADDCLLGIAKLLGLCTANITKSFWAPVNVDAKASLSQAPFAKIDSLVGVCRQMIFLAAYEPFEWSLNNQLRTDRLKSVRRIMILLHCAYGGAQKRIEDLEMKRFDRRGRLAHQLEVRLRPRAEDLSMEIMKSLTAFGKVLTPKDVANIDTSDLDDKAQMVSDMLQGCRRELLYYRGATPGEVNMVLNTCVFHESLVDVAGEMRKLKDSMVNFDPTKYKSTWTRAQEFFFLEYWNAFWDEFPRRMTLATQYDQRIWKDSIKYSLAFAVACAFTLNFDHSKVYFFGMAILMRLAQQTASETLQVGIMRIFGLCIGASLSYITITHTHRYIEEVLLTMTFVFVALCFVNNPTLINGAQYAMLVSMTGLRLASDPALLLNRVADNVFAFIAYFLICTFIFPVDPMRILWNTRTKLLKGLNAITQQCVALGSSPVTRDQREIAETMGSTQKLLMGQHALMREYADWMTKSETEPLLRGGDYPTEGCRLLLRHLSYITAIQELMFYAIQMMHRDRSKDPVQEVSQIFLDAIHVYRPFLEDLGRIVYAIMQDFINSTEFSTGWTIENVLHNLWKANCANKGLHRLVGNIQKNYIAALLELSPEEKAGINQYMSSSFVNDKVTTAAANAALSGGRSATFSGAEGQKNVTNMTFAPYGVNDSFAGKGDAWDESRMLANSFQMTPGAQWSADDTKSFGTLATGSELFLKSISNLLLPMVRIHEFEKSRHPGPPPTRTNFKATPSPLFPSPK